MLQESQVLSVAQDLKGNPEGRDPMASMVFLATQVHVEPLVVLEPQELQELQELQEIQAILVTKVTKVTKVTRVIKVPLGLRDLKVLQGSPVDLGTLAIKVSRANLVHPATKGCLVIRD